MLRCGIRALVGVKDADSKLAEAQVEAPAHAVGMEAEVQQPVGGEHPVDAHPCREARGAAVALQVIEARARLEIGGPGDAGAPVLKLASKGVEQLIVLVD